ncbi:hypothetical protein [Paenibacillus sanguinis]|uniref:hypothetical protein n=1 Tax=Paenibacillus sanguinis TaxID=225906 RepID=UPI00037136B6|nr:hypothetical protein [Paenibacillus sanguinis]
MANPVMLTPSDSQELRGILRRFSRSDLIKTARDYVGYAAHAGEPCSLPLDEIEGKTDEQLRQFIFERDWPGCRWSTKGVRADGKLAGSVHTGAKGSH